MFRSLKSELGLRPVFHAKENQADGHLLITVLAYQCDQVLRKTLKEHDIKDSWACPQEILAAQHRGPPASSAGTDEKFIRRREVA